MTYNYFSRNGQLLPSEQAVVSLNSVEYSYGYGVYETIRVSKGEPHFLSEHCTRLMHSAKIIDLSHSFAADFVEQSARELISKNKVEACNLKILLIGGTTKDTATLYMLCLNPLFPDRKLYQIGVHVITENYERPFPQAKTLNMLPSYLAYRHAREAEAYDALLINRAGCITEGTRTNFLALQGRTIFSPPATEILPGVTRHHVLQVANQNGFKVVEQDIKLAEIDQYDAACLTSTSSKILPLRSIDKHIWPEQSPDLQELIQAFNEFLSSYS